MVQQSGKGLLIKNFPPSKDNSRSSGYKDNRTGVSHLGKFYMAGGFSRGGGFALLPIKGYWPM